MAIVIRQFSFSDAYEAVINLWSKAGEGIHLGPSDDPEEIKKKSDFDPGLFLVAEKDEGIVGSAIGGFDGRRGLIYHLAVAKEERTSGLGSLMMQEVERHLGERGCIRAYLLVTNDNVNAIDFYAKRGWSQMDLLILAKNLS